MSARIDTTAAKQDEKNEQQEFRVVDRRHFLNLEDIDKSTAAEQKPRYPSFVEELVGRMAETERKFEEKKALFEAEIARIKSRLEADYSRRVDLEKQKILLPLIDVLDNLERALAAATKDGESDSLRQGVEMTASLFRAKLQALGVEAIPTLGQVFDPNLGQAVGVIAVSDPSEDGVIKEEVLRGYRLGEQVLRHAHVLVGRHSS